ncbi:hypothetical protein ACO0R3_002789 [Hanseniaspora guilliermondii]
MSRFENNDLTPMDGGLQVKKETINFEPKEDAILGSDDINKMSLDAYISNGNFKTLAKNMQEYKLALERQDKAIEKANDNIQQISNSMHQKRMDVLKQLKEKIDYLEELWDETEYGIRLSKSLITNEMVYDVLINTYQSYKALTWELSTDLEKLIELHNLDDDLQDKGETENHKQSVQNLKKESKPSKKTNKKKKKSLINQDHSSSFEKI